MMMVMWCGDEDEDDDGWFTPTISSFVIIQSHRDPEVKVRVILTSRVSGVHKHTNDKKVGSGARFPDPES